MAIQSLIVMESWSKVVEITRTLMCVWQTYRKYFTTIISLQASDWWRGHFTHLKCAGRCIKLPPHWKWMVHFYPNYTCSHTLSLLKKAWKRGTYKNKLFRTQRDNLWNLYFDAGGTITTAKCIIHVVAGTYVIAFIFLKLLNMTLINVVR